MTIRIYKGLVRGFDALAITAGGAVLLAILMIYVAVNHIGPTPEAYRLVEFAGDYGAAAIVSGCVIVTAQAVTIAIRMFRWRIIPLALICLFTGFVAIGYGTKIAAVVGIAAFLVHALEPRK